MSKSAKELAEQEKKIRKRRQLFLDPKESNANKFKNLQWLIEEDPDAVNFCKTNHSLAGLVLNDYAQQQVIHCKKGKHTVKAAMVHLKLIEFVGKVFPYNEFHVFESLFTIFENYLSIGSEVTLRKASYEILLNIFESKGEYSGQFARLILGCLNIGCLVDLPPNQPYPALVNDLFIPQAQGGQNTPINEKELAMEFIDLFMERLMNKNCYKTFLSIAEHICALIFPTFSKTITLNCVVQNGGVEDVTVPMQEYILAQMKKLMSSSVRECFLAEEGALPFLEHILSTSLNFSPENYMNALNYFTFFYTEFVAMTPTAESFEKIRGAERLLEFRRYVIQCIDIPFDRAELNPSISKFTTALHKRMMELLNVEMEVIDEMKDLLIATFVNNLNKLLICYRDDAVSPLADTIITCYIKWRHSPTAYSKLYDMLHQFYSSANLLQQICQKYLHVSMMVISEPKSKPVDKSNPTIKYQTTESEFKMPHHDPTFKTMLTLKPAEVYELWEGLWFMLQDTCIEVCAKNCIETVRKACQMLILFFDESKMNLMEVFGTYFLRTLATCEEVEVKKIAALGLCDLFMREKRYIIDSYSTFFESIVPLIPTAPYEFLVALHQLFSLRIPGASRMIVPVMSMIQQLPSPPDKFSENNVMKIIGLLNSLIYSQELYPAVLDMIQFNEILGDFNEALFTAQRRLLVLFQGTVAQETLLWGIACHLNLLIIQKNQTELPMNLLKCLLGYISNEKYHCVCQIISSFSRLDPPLPSDLLKELHITCFQSFASLSSHAIGSLIYALLDYLLSPKVAPSVYSLDIGNIMIEGLTSALKNSDKPGRVHRVDAVEAAEAYLGTYFTLLGTQGALFEHLPGQDVTDQNVKWFCNGNTLYSIAQEKEKNSVTIMVRNSVGRFEWKFTESEVPGWKKTIEVFEELGDIQEGDGIIREKIHSDINDLSQMIDIIPNELVWDFPVEIKSKEVYDAFLETTTNECVDMRKKLEQIPRQKMEIHPQPLFEKTPIGIEMPLTTGLLMTEMFFIDALSITSRLTILPSHDKFRSTVAQLDKTPVRRTHPIGVVYMEKGVTEPKQIYNAEKVSQRYVGFSASLGEQMNINNYKGFNGGLDLTGIDGSTVLYYKSSTREMIYHENARMLTSENEERKKQMITKDNVMIIWDENEYSHLIDDKLGESYSSITSFSRDIEESNDGKVSVKIVVKPGVNGIDSVEVYRKKDVKVFGPLVDNMVVPESLIGMLARETAMNADDCASERTIGDNVLLPYLQRKQLIEEMIPKNPTYSQKGYLSTLSVFLDDKENARMDN